MITSSFTLNSLGTSFRRYLADKLELVTAIRLPDTAFKRFSNTEVVADILLFRKLTEAERVETTKKNYEYPNWVRTSPSGKYTSVGEAMMINEWFMNK